MLLNRFFDPKLKPGEFDSVQYTTVHENHFIVETGIRFESYRST